MTKYRVGESVSIDSDRGFCTGGLDTVTAVLTQFTKDTGEPYEVVYCGNSKFRADDGRPLTPPWGYYLRKVSKVSKVGVLK